MTATEIKGLVDLRPFVDAIVECVRRGKNGDLDELRIRMMVDGLQERISFGTELAARVDGLSEDTEAVAVAASFLGSPFRLGVLLPLLTFSEERAHQALSDLEELKVIAPLDGERRVFVFSTSSSESVGNGVAMRAAAPSQREREVARLVAQGLTNYQIGMRLGLSQRTVETYVRRLFVKLDVSSRSQIVVWYMGQANGVQWAEDLPISTKRIAT
ncbi:LuxR C-terminal-related transcriptional regulator [Brevibacterium sediminis]